MDTGSEDDENIMFDLNKKSSLLLPTINDKNFTNNADFRDSFLRLTSMVRRVYFSYLYKSLLSNYAISCTAKDVDDFDYRVKNCASQMELFAVRNALETSLYRKAMIKLISEVKEHTNEQKVYKTLMSFLITTPEKSDVAIQTDEIITTTTTTTMTLKNENLNTEEKNDISTTEGENNSNDHQDITIKIESSNDINSEIETQEHSINEAIDSKIELNNIECQKSNLKIDNETLQLNGNPIINKNSTIIANESINAKAEDSQDSLFQTMEDMFCESDDSSDLTTLIEKHSTTNQFDNSLSQLNLNCTKNDEKKLLKLQEFKRKRSAERNFLKAKKRNTRISPIGFNDLKSSKYRKKVNEIWLVERVHQSSKLKSTMLEISLINYRKYGRIKEKFIALFGESDDDDTQPESPICIEEHLQACKERIAPWIVKHLTPFYNQKRISSRELFKTICRHVTDMLIISNTFPDEAAVEHYMKDFFKNRKSINTEADIYL
ncbi:uncharacterized protein LOC127281215 [Leptopilina boulardi]|uniref:uncharacterized protein LOC127281215 n=1 Tax=Leptopilina boulardi TaxID=63433 RepID=UPI0021F5DC80|nr:uncharacterized protein LOC127281215 [Leptopilina boulardi]